MSASGQVSRFVSSTIKSASLPSSRADLIARKRWGEDIGVGVGVRRDGLLAPSGPSSGCSRLRTIGSVGLTVGAHAEEGLVGIDGAEADADLLNVIGAATSDWRRPRRCSLGRLGSSGEPVVAELRHRVRVSR